MLKEVLALVKKYYQIEGQLQQLAGYEDKNFLLTTTDQRKFIVKLSIDTSDFSYQCLSEQNQLLQYLATFNQVNFQTSQMLLAKDKTALHKVTVQNTPYLFRILTFLEGQFIGDLIEEVEDGLFESYGTFLAHLDQYLNQGTFDKKAISTRIHEWDLLHFLTNKKYLSYVKNPNQRKIAHYFFQQFEYFVLPKLQQLRKTIIHGDANEWNTLARNNQVMGIIDFGDLGLSAHINELGIGIAYVLLNREKPIEKACLILKSYHQIFPLLQEELDILYYLIAGRLVTSVCQSAYNTNLNPENKYIAISAKPAWQLLTTWISINPTFAANEFRKACNFAPKNKPKIADLLQSRSKHISKSLSVNYKQNELNINRSAFQYMYDASGRSYLDCVNNIAHVGHCHPKVVEAAHRQMLQLNTNTRYLYESLNEYAEMLCAKFPASLSKVFFVNSGSAASDLAIRLALTHNKRNNLIILEHGYHGNTRIGIDISSYKFQGKGGQGQADYIFKAPIPDPFRGKYRGNNPETARQYAAEVADILTQATHQNRPIAAFIGESIIGCGGQVVPPPTYVDEVYKAVRAAGGLCIADEVQVGFGRVGTHFWGFEQHGVVPDIVILGKPIGNGHPLAAVVTTDEVAASFENGMEFFSSFGGNPVSCEVGKTVLEVIETEKLQQNALQIGNFLIEKLKILQHKFPNIIGDVRGTGLFLGIEIIENQNSLQPNTVLAAAIIEDLKGKHGIFLSTDGPFNNVLKFKPPLCFSMANAHFLLEKLEAVIFDNRA